MLTECISLKSIKKIENNSLRYDIQTKNHHNFFANNILVHNSMCAIYFFNEQWNTATLGSFASDQARWAKEYLDKNIDTSKLNKDTTYIAEIIYPANRIVISYKFEGLVLLSAFNNVLGIEISHYALSYLSNVGFKIVEKQYYNSIDELVEVCKKLSHNEEGFVVRFSNGFRVKVKGDEYLKAHRAISNCTPCRVWDCLLSDMDIENVKVLLPEEIQNDYNRLVNIFTTKFDTIVNKIKSLYEATLSLSDKELGQLNMEYDEQYKGFIFLARKKDFFNNVKIGGSAARKSVFNMFYPKGNVLPEYTPCSSINMFEIDN